MEFEDKFKQFEKAARKYLGDVLKAGEEKPVGSLSGAEELIGVMDVFVGGKDLFVNRFFPSYRKLKDGIDKEKDSNKKREKIKVFLNGQIGKSVLKDGSEQDGVLVVSGLKQALESYLELLPYEGMLQGPFMECKEDMNWSFKVEE